MTFVLVVFLVGLVLGMAAVASNPSPYFAALGLVAVAGMGCSILLGHGGSFLSLVLVLIYLGGMLVVFAYSAALAAEPYPEGWGDWPVMGMLSFYITCVLLSVNMFSGEWYWGGGCSGEELNGMTMMIRGDVGGVALLYSMGGGMLVVGGWVLLLTLFVVLELTRGLSRGAIRAV